MNEQLIFRTTDIQEFEVLKFESDFFDTQRFQRKTLTLYALIELLSSYVKKDRGEAVTIYHTNIFESENENVVAYTKTSEEEVFILQIKEQYIRTFYNEKYYKIIHPNCFVKIKVKDNKIKNMFIYPYKEYKGLETTLFDNPFPNFLAKNETCMGSADKTVKETKVKTVLSIIETAYTHSSTGFKSEKLKDTKKAFEYLMKNKFPYNGLTSSNMTLNHLIEMCKEGR